MHNYAQITINLCAQYLDLCDYILNLCSTVQLNIYFVALVPSMYVTDFEILNCYC